MCVFAEKVCVEEMKNCDDDKTCSMLHQKMQVAMKKAGGHGGKGGDGKGENQKGKDYQKGEKDGSGRRKLKYDQGKSFGSGKYSFGSKGGDKGSGKGDHKGGESGDKYGHDKDGKDQEPSKEVKAAIAECKTNTLCSKLLDCKMKHKESGGKDDGKGDGHNHGL